jgi:hypothetical protein
MGWKGGKEMNMIGHDDIATNDDIMPLAVVAKMQKVS